MLLSLHPHFDVSSAPAVVSPLTTVSPSCFCFALLLFQFFCSYVTPRHFFHSPTLASPGSYFTLHGLFHPPAVASPLLPPGLLFLPNRVLFHLQFVVSSLDFNHPPPGDCFIPPSVSTPRLFFHPSVCFILPSVVSSFRLIFHPIYCFIILYIVSSSRLLLHPICFILSSVTSSHLLLYPPVCYFTPSAVPSSRPLIHPVCFILPSFDSPRCFILPSDDSPRLLFHPPFC